MEKSAPDNFYLVTVPLYSDISRDLLSKIIRQSDMDRNEFVRQCRKILNKG